VASLAAVLVAAGRSRRIGTDKLWIDLWGRPVWRWSLDDLLSLAAVDRVAVVVPADAVARFASHLPPTDRDRCTLVAGGDERVDSVLAGLAALAGAGLSDETPVLVHDAARPVAGPELIERVVAAAGAAGGVVPVLPVVDTLLRVEADAAGESVNRREMVAAQTPQLGRLGDLRAALGGRGTFTDEASALLAAGIAVRTVAGDPANRKLTEPADEAPLRAALRERALAGLGGPIEPPRGGRVGIGFDAHRLEAGRALRLGGVDFPDEPRGLAGHSDGDAALHALADAVLSAAGVGDLGTLFPSGDARWRGADSAELLQRSLEHVTAAGWRVSSADLVVVARRPTISPRREEMRRRIAALLGIDQQRVGVKGTTSDGLGFAGEEGIAAYAVAALEPA
jgi:2-C-methyl-D-erythritol 4-phosphate cytidylyltransferase / 2-C-methyl-D-erythritol 2,4-cyclodiphosphate synthase